MEATGRRRGAGGMAGSRVGLHVIVPSLVPASAYTAAPWAAVLAVNDSSTLKQAATAGIPMRIYRSTVTDGASPSDAANILLDQDWSATTHFVLATESDNANNPDWQAQTIRALRGRGWSRGILCGAWATGTPTAYDLTTHADHTPHFPALLPWAPVFAACDGLALDEYMASLPGDAVWPDQLYWVGSRHRLYAHCLAQHGIPIPRIVIKEAGLDRVWPGTTRIGRTGVTAAQYAALAAALDAEDRRDGYVATRLYFTLGPTPDWSAFDYADALPALAAYVQSQKGPTVSLVGIDVSSNNGPVDWAQVAASGRQFAWSKATEGTGYTSPTFAADWPAMRAAGLVRGSYAYARPDLANDPVAEADYFLAAIPDLQPGDLLALDIEEGNGDFGAWAKAWLDHVQGRVGFRPLLYSYAGYLQACNLTAASTGNPALWLAAYEQDWPAVPAGWPEIALWQHTQGATVPGVAGGVDESYSALTLDQLRALGKPEGSNPVDAALAYYEQLGVRIDPSHAVYTLALKPLYDYWAAHQGDVIDGAPVGDLLKPGPLVAGETGATWGPDKRTAATVRLSNRVVGAYQDTAGVWHGYQSDI